jgi:hypothetical protein
MIMDKRFLLMFITIVTFSPVYAQSYSPQQIELAERLHSLAKNAPPELAYIQTSKDIYETGEDLWFKVNLLDAQYLIPSLLSKTLYLQLLNESTKKAVWQEKYEIQDGFANGRVYLDSNLPEGVYLLAAYTPNSFFGDPTEFYAIRRIKVVTDITTWKETLTIPVPDKVNTLQFTTFPEGGNLVSGIPSKVAYKAVNINGEPVDIKGTLFEDTTPIVEFKSIHAGMGSFIFTPDNSKKYFIRLSEPAIDSIFPLPEIYSSGMTMQLIKRDKESLSFKISQRPERNEEDIYLRVQCRGEVYGMTTARLSKDLLIKVPLSGLPQGITEITLFNSSLEPIAERLVYVNTDKKLNITTELSKEIYPTRGKSTLKITVKDEKGKPVMANLGVSVFEKLYQNPCDSDNILSYVNLSSQLKGRIYSPSFYFNSKSNDRDEALDLLMLTQGWRRYIWNEMNLKKITEVHQQVIFDGIKGEVNYPDRKNKIPKDQTFVIVFSPNVDQKNVLVATDSIGIFLVPQYYLKAYERDYIYMKPLGSPGTKPIIKVPDPFETINLLMRSNEVIYPMNSILNLKETSTDSYPSGINMLKIKEVTIKGQKGNIIHGKYLGFLDSLARFGNSEKDDYYVCSRGILNCPICGSKAIGNTKPIDGQTYNYYFDGVVKKVEYLNSKIYLNGVEIVNPINSITEEELLKMNNLARTKAYFDSREFYKPNYDQDTEDVIIPDFRNTLLWEPSIFTDTNGEALVNFFCSDINSDFVGRIEGVSGEGLLGTGYFNFTVRKLKLTP